MTNLLYAHTFSPPTTKFTPVDSPLPLTSEKLSSSNVKRSVVVWNARNKANSVSGIPPRNADNFDFNGEPGTPKTAPRARDPRARLYDGSITSNGEASRCMVREHVAGGGVDAEKLIGSLSKEAADLDRICVKEDVVVKAFATPHTKRNRRAPI